MHRDTQEELDRLEAELLAEEPAAEKKSKARPVRGYKIYNADRTDEDSETYSRELLKDPSYRRLAILAALLSLGILAVVLYWLIRLRGAF